MHHAPSPKSNLRRSPCKAAFAPPASSDNSPFLTCGILSASVRGLQDLFAPKPPKGPKLRVTTHFRKHLIPVPCQARQSGGSQPHLHTKRQTDPLTEKASLSLQPCHADNAGMEAGQRPDCVRGVAWHREVSLTVQSKQVDSYTHICGIFSSAALSVTQRLKGHV